MITDSELTIRPMWSQDVAFVGSSWMHSIESKLVRRRRLPVVNLLLNQAPVKFIACDKNDPEHIYGWIVAGYAGDSEPVVHFMYVKFLYRRMGIAKKLASAALKRLNSNIDLYSISGDSNARLLYSHQGLRSDKAKGNLTPFEHIKLKYRLAYDPHALLCSVQDDNT